MKLKLYSVSDKYINYIREFDNRVYDNKEESRTHTRKYVGIVLTINGFNYYIPMSSPKDSDYYDNEHKRIRKSINTIIRMTKINNKNEEILRGTLRISNMIPVPIEEISQYLPEEETDLSYLDIIRDEIEFLQNPKNEKEIFNKARLVYKQKNLGVDINYLNNCVDYKKLEQKCKEYIEKID